MARAFGKSSALLPVLSLLHFKNFLELLRDHEISHSSVDDVLPEIAMRWQRIFLFSD